MAIMTAPALLFEKLMRWHVGTTQIAFPNGHSVVATVHPWETGRDNCPDWEIGLSAMQIDPDIEVYERKDTDHVDPTMRPSKEQYDKYVFDDKIWSRSQLGSEDHYQ